MKGLTKILPLVAFAALGVGLAGAQTADEILAKSRSPEGVLSFQAHVDMTIAEVNGAFLCRSAEQYWVRDGETTKRLVAFETPSSVRNTRFLAVASDSEPAQRLLFSPATGKVSELGSTQGSRWFMGSDFSLEDICPRSPSLDTNVLVGRENLGATPCYVVESRPRAAGQYLRVVHWISTENFVLLKAEMYDQSGLAKRLVVSKIEVVDGIPTARSLKMDDLRHWSSTVLEFSDIRYNKETPAALFTTAYLAKGSL